MLTISEPLPSSTQFTKANAHADRAIAFIHNIHKGRCSRCPSHRHHQHYSLRPMLMLTEPLPLPIHIQHPFAIRVARYPTIILIKHGINTSWIYKIGHIIISMESITSCISHKAFANTTSMSTIKHIT